MLVNAYCYTIFRLYEFFLIRFVKYATLKEASSAVQSYNNYNMGKNVSLEVKFSNKSADEARKINELSFKSKQGTSASAYGKSVM